MATPARYRYAACGETFTVPVAHSSRADVAGVRRTACAQIIAALEDASAELERRRRSRGRPAPDRVGS
jgi:hypothetical protein